MIPTNPAIKFVPTVMNHEELELKLQIILDQEETLIKNGVWTFSIDTDNTMSYDSADALIDLFQNLSPDQDLIDKFKGFLSNQRAPLTLSLRFYTFIELNLIEEAFNLLNTHTSILELISHIFALVEQMFTSQKLQFLNLRESYSLKTKLNAISPSPSYMNPIDSTVIRAGKNGVITTLTAETFNQVRLETRGINIEINRDKEKVKELISFLNFEDKYNEMLTEIDVFLNTDSEIVTSAMVGNLRSFFEELTLDLAARVAANEGEEIPQYQGIDSPIGRARKYLKIKLELSNEDDKLITAFIKILHTEGGHAMISNKNYFRLARNISIEIVLFILSRYYDKYPDEE